MRAGGRVYILAGLIVAAAVLDGGRAVSFAAEERATSEERAVVATPETHAAVLGLLRDPTNLTRPGPSTPDIAAGGYARSLDTPRATRAHAASVAHAFTAERTARSRERLCRLQV